MLGIPNTDRVQYSRKVHGKLHLTTIPSVVATNALISLGYMLVVHIVVWHAFKLSLRVRFREFVETFGQITEA